jgi:hypothetical protein
VLRFILHAVGAEEGTPIGPPLPAGSIRVDRARLILGATRCHIPLYRNAMREVALSTQLDVLVGRDGGEVGVLWDAVVWHDNHPFEIPDLLLCKDSSGRHWLTPTWAGPHIHLTNEGLRLGAEPWFVTWHERCEAVDRAADEYGRAKFGGAN